MSIFKAKKNWQLIGSEKLTEGKSTGLHLRHTPTGMEVLHLFNKDTENLFAFGFKTLPENSKGAAHILEHSVLCGSKHYPLKDPFMQLNSQSVKTFLNAMTFPDKTVYPASSLIEADYFNLMAVYGDAVFFPLLTQAIFSQEAHRFEIDDEGKISIQGVVFNEMQGSYSSFDNIATRWAMNSCLPDTPYAYDSGGDPAEIPLLTRQELIDFHAKYYHPSNCRLFLYGNIPTERQLDFLEDRFLSAFGSEAAEDYAKNKNIHLNPFDLAQKLTRTGPFSSEKKGATVTLNWVLGESADDNLYMEAVLLSEILMGHDGSPLQRSLLNSGLGEDIAPQSGMEGEIAWLIFSCGMRGVKKKNAEKLESLIIKVLEGLAENGIDSADLESALMAVDFSHREIRRSHGPWSLTLMRRSMRAWFNGGNPFDPLKSRETFKRIKQKIIQEPDYLKNLIKKLLLDNKHRLLFTIIPDKAYDRQRENQVQSFIDSCTEKPEIIRQKKAALKNFQQGGDDEQNRSLIPHLKPSQLTEKIDYIKTEKINIADVPVFVHKEDVNGIVYADIAFPADILEPDLYPYLPFYTTVLTNCGFAGMDWAEAAVFCGRTLGEFGAHVFVSSITEFSKKRAEVQNLHDAAFYEGLYKSDPLLGRSWVFVRAKMLEEKTQEGIDLVFSCLSSPDFFDLRRLKDLALEYRNNFSASIIPSAHEYCVSRAACKLSRSKAIEEIWNGLSQLYTSRRLASMKTEDLSGILETIHKKLMAGGLTVNITAESDALQNIFNCLNKHLQNKNVPKAPCAVADKTFFDLTDIPQNNQAKNAAPLKVYVAPSETGFAGSVFSAAAFGTKEAVCETLFAHWFSNNVLWEKIRTMGGAYGAYLFTDSIEQVFSFITYRDPDPYRSLNTLLESLRNLAELNFDEAAVERMITGCYSKEIQPRSPSAKGFTGFIRSLYGIDDGEREEKLRLLLLSQAGDIQNAAKGLAKRAEQAKKIIICGKNMVSTGTIINLPL